LRGNSSLALKVRLQKDQNRQIARLVSHPIREEVLRAFPEEKESTSEPNKKLHIKTPPSQFGFGEGKIFFKS
tara:strand:+ start:3825 stop:4040 length:216 start_codon:yes stop_codon:yes gene_type:complete